jgi:hypothetical protein
VHAPETKLGQGGSSYGAPTPSPTRRATMPVVGPIVGRLAVGASYSLPTRSSDWGSDDAAA